MRVGLISSIEWRTPPEHFGPYERVVSLIAEGLIEQGIDVTLFATKNSKTKGQLMPTVPLGLEEDRNLDRKVWEYLHLSQIFNNLTGVDILHNHFDFMPLVFSPLIDIPMVTTIHGFSSSKVLPIYEKHNGETYYVSISNADRARSLDYEATVYHGIDIENFTFNDKDQGYLIYFGRIHPDKGTKEAIEIAKKCNRNLIIAGVIQDNEYFDKWVRPTLGKTVKYVGSVGPSRRDELLKNAYCLIHPINFREPFGLSVVEAMACGTPVVAYPKGSMNEIITDGKTGFLPSNVDEFVKCVSEVRKLNRMDCRREVEERFGVKRMVGEYIGIYENVLKKHKRRSIR